MQGVATHPPVVPVTPRRYPHTGWWYLKWFFIALQLVIFCLIVVTVSLGYGIYNKLSEVVPDVRLMMARNKAEPTRIYAADGSLLAELKGEQRDWVPLDELKVWRQRGGKNVHELGNMAKATLAIEDWRFYTHP